MMSTAWCPSSWNWRSLRSGTVWPRWTSMPVGSMPYLTRSGFPVLTLRSSFLRNSSSGTILSTPLRIRACCSSTVFTITPISSFPLPLLLEPAQGDQETTDHDHQTKGRQEHCNCNGYPEERIQVRIDREDEGRHQLTSCQAAETISYTSESGRPPRRHEGGGR